MTESEIEMAAAIGALKAVIMSMLAVQAAQVGGEDAERRRAYLEGVRDQVLVGWNVGKLDENQRDLQTVLQRVPVQIRAMFDNLDVG